MIVKKLAGIISVEIKFVSPRLESYALLILCESSWSLNQLGAQIKMN